MGNQLNHKKVFYKIQVIHLTKKLKK